MYDTGVSNCTTMAYIDTQGRVRSAVCGFWPWSTLYFWRLSMSQVRRTEELFAECSPVRRDGGPIRKSDGWFVYHLMLHPQRSFSNMGWSFLWTCGTQQWTRWCDRLLRLWFLVEECRIVHQVAQTIQLARSGSTIVHFKAWWSGF